MVLIYDDRNAECSKLIRDELLRRRIPCAFGTDEKLSRYALVIVLPLGAAIESLDSEILLYSDFDAVRDDSRRKGELLRLVSRIEDILFIKYGFDPYKVAGGAFCDSPDECRYFGSKCDLRDIERLIVRFLVICKDNRADADVIRAYCLDGNTDTRAVAVHISKINSRLRFHSTIKAINSKKNLGYRLTFI